MGAEKDGEQDIRDRVAAEILQTEQAYVLCLEQLVDDYAIPLRSRSELLSEEEHTALFGKAPLLLGLNQKFLAELEQVMSEWNQKPKEERMMGDVFKRFVPFFKMYSDYAVEYAPVSALLSDILKTSNKKAFQKWMQEPIQDKSMLEAKAQEALAAAGMLEIKQQEASLATTALSPEPVSAELAVWNGPKPPPPHDSSNSTDAVAITESSGESSDEVGELPRSVSAPIGSDAPGTDPLPRANSTPSTSPMPRIRNKMQELPSLLIGPIQRIPRYQLLLQELLKRTPDTHPDYKEIQASLEKVKEVALHINETVRAGQSRQQILDLEEQFVKPPEFVSPSRFFLYSGKMSKKNQTNSGEETYTFHLFNDLLAYSSSTATNKFKLNAKVPIDAAFLAVDELPETDNKDRYYKISINNSVKSIVVYLKSAEDKAKWLEAFGAAIENRDRSIQKTEARFQAPTLDSAMQATACQLCENPFSILFRKRYTCTICGRGICDPCSTNRMILAGKRDKSGNKDGRMHRVCDKCFQELVPNAAKAAQEAGQLVHDGSFKPKPVPPPPMPKKKEGTAQKIREARPSFAVNSTRLEEARKKMDLSGIAASDLGPPQQADLVPYSPKVPKRPANVPKIQISAFSTPKPSIPTRTRPVSLGSDSPPSASGTPSAGTPFSGTPSLLSSIRSRALSNSTTSSPNDLGKLDEEEKPDKEKSGWFSKFVSAKSKSDTASSPTTPTETPTQNPDKATPAKYPPPTSPPPAQESSVTKQTPPSVTKQTSNHVSPSAKQTTPITSSHSAHKKIAAAPVFGDTTSPTFTQPSSKSSKPSSAVANSPFKQKHDSFSSSSVASSSGSKSGSVSAMIEQRKKLDSTSASDPVQNISSGKQKKFGSPSSKPLSSATSSRGFCKHCGEILKTAPGSSAPIKFCPKCGKSV
eukprot:gb/GEZN01001336.1/.p1 GENE.gb/GEZN01001336.1/~~gb/GEZN01001336.1/.p1  ORF type:complete len:924 (-),score=218.59 gb/GEZN01001336.1/:286-3057(-)